MKFDKIYTIFISRPIVLIELPCSHILISRYVVNKNIYKLHLQIRISHFASKTVNPRTWFNHEKRKSLFQLMYLSKFAYVQTLWIWTDKNKVKNNNKKTTTTTTKKKKQSSKTDTSKEFNYNNVSTNI